MIMYTGEKLALYGPGEWIDEPDEMDFEYMGYSCKIKRNMMGSLCGYVKVPKDHPFFGKSYDDIPIEVHGGLTYAENLDDGYWIGFDCGHSGDLSPYSNKQRELNPFFKELHEDLQKTLKEFNPNCAWIETYKNIEYVIVECQKMVEQLRSECEPLV